MVVVLVIALVLLIVVIVLIGIAMRPNNIVVRSVLMLLAWSLMGCGIFGFVSSLWILLEMIWRYFEHY